MKNRTPRKSLVLIAVYGTVILSLLYISTTGFVISLRSALQNNTLTLGQTVEQTWLAVLDIKNLATFVLILYMSLFVTALVTSPQGENDRLN
ncbi:MULTISPECIES: hypothetical protein [Rothia]|uniref:hypothetical protein n=1 Tax=Rothia TaxID=32207 RepID=UPI001F30DD49|nr:hypothetical protein [Rothia nasimurium]